MIRDNKIEVGQNNRKCMQIRQLQYQCGDICLKTELSSLINFSCLKLALLVGAGYIYKIRGARALVPIDGGTSACSYANLSPLK